MNKAQIMSHIAEAAGLSINIAEHILNTTHQGTFNTLSNTVSLVGFSHFDVKKTQSLQGRQSSDWTRNDDSGKIDSLLQS
jgi:nucleoid DNA-binding protein